MTEHTQAGTPAAVGAGPKGHVIFPATVLVATGIGTLALGIVFFAAEVHHATPAQIGCLSATWSFHYIIGCVLLRLLTARLRPRRSIVMSAVAMGLAVLLVLVVKHFWLVYVAYALYGLATAFFWPPLMGWLSTGSEGVRLNRIMGVFNLSWSAGSIVGPLLAGLLARHSPRLPIAVAGALYLTAAAGAGWAVRRLPAEDGLHLERPGTDGAAAEPEASTPLRYPAWAGLFAVYVVLGVLNNVFPLDAQARLGLSKPTVGTLLLLRALFTAAGLGLMGRITVWHFRSDFMAAGLGLFAVTLALMPALSGPLPLAGLMAVVGVLVAQGYANSLFHGVAGSRHRGARMAVHEALLSAGLVCGSAAGGLLFQKTGYSTVCYAAAALLALMALTGAGIAWRRRQGHDHL